MDTAVIQDRLNALVAAMLAKGLVRPESEAHIKADEQPLVMLTWKKFARRDTNGSDRKYEFLRADTIAEALDKADAHVAGLPSKDEARDRAFLSALDDVIAFGREVGVDVDYVNPLVTTMKRLSENVLTHQPEHGAA